MTNLQQLSLLPSRRLVPLSLSRQERRKCPVTDNGTPFIEFGKIYFYPYSLGRWSVCLITLSILYHIHYLSSSLLTPPLDETDCLIGFLHSLNSSPTCSEWEDPYSYLVLILTFSEIGERGLLGNLPNFPSSPYP